MSFIKNKKRWSLYLFRHSMINLPDKDGKFLIKLIKNK